MIFLGEGLSPKAWSRLIERKTRLMNAGSIMKPRKAQVKDKGLGAESGDFEASEDCFVTDKWAQTGSNRRPTD
jgi:hypothetical protein